MIAVPDGYGSVTIHGISDDNFSLATESSTVEIVGDFYLQGMSAAYTYLHKLEESGELDGQCFL